MRISATGTSNTKDLGEERWVVFQEALGPAPHPTRLVLTVAFPSEPAPPNPYQSHRATGADFLLEFYFLKITSSGWRTHNALYR